MSKTQAGKNIKVTLPTKLAKEVEMIVQEEGHDSISEFGRYCIQDYIWRKQHGLLKAPGGHVTENPMVDLFTLSGEPKCSALVL